MARPTMADRWCLVFRTASRHGPDRAIWVAVGDSARSPTWLAGTLTEPGSTIS